MEMKIQHLKSNGKKLLSYFLLQIYMRAKQNPNGFVIKTVAKQKETSFFINCVLIEGVPPRGLVKIIHFFHLKM